MVKPKVLVIDDESSILNTLEILLRGEGFEVEVTQSGREALERLADIGADIVLTDVRMPGVTGLEILTAVREKDPETPVILMTGAWWVDPVTSLVIVGAIGWGTWGLLKDSVKMALHAVPERIDETAVRAFLSGLPGVAVVHDLHIWPMSTTETALTAHLVMPGGYPGDAFLRDLAHELEHDFHIGHATVQVETGTDDHCADCG